MLARVRRRADRLRVLARRGVVGLGALRSTGLVGAVRVGGLVAFAREWRRIPGGPTTILRFHAANTPDKVALAHGERRLSYRELDEQVGRLASALADLGVRPRDRVAVMMRNCHHYVVVQWAVLRLGAIAVQVGYRLKAAEIAYILGNSEAAAFLYDAEHEPEALAGSETAGTPSPARLVRVPDGLERLVARGADVPPARSPAEAGGVMVYTSGTTGKPKGAAREIGGALHEAAADFIRQVGFRHDERHLVVCPLYHSAAPAFVAISYLLGGTVFVQERFQPEETLALIARERITSSFMVPTMLGRIAALPPEVRARHDTSSLRALLSGAAPLPADTARRVEEAFGPILYNFYGATETGLVTLARPGEHVARPGTIGRALSGNDIRILDDRGHEVPPGEVGEVWVKNDMLVAGYHGDREATTAALRDGYFSVGDLGRVDADGFYYLADRKHDMVISGGVNIYPLEIEEHLHAHPAVLECAVIGVPDPDWGEALKAFVVPRTGVTPDEALGLELREHCKGGLADYKCPKAFEFLEALPRTPTGKVLKRDLRGRP